MRTIYIPEVSGALLYEFDRHEDSRGYFQEVYSVDRYNVGQPLQNSVSLSKKNVVRGLHVAQFGKLCSCLRGSLYDVVADVRPDSPTYRHWFGVWLTEDNRKQLYIPPHCAHGFYSAEDNTILLYCQDGTYSPGTDRCVHWREPTLAIDWPVAQDYFLSQKDLQAGFLDVEV